MVSGFGFSDTATLPFDQAGVGGGAKVSTRRPPRPLAASGCNTPTDTRILDFNRFFAF
jgi:hypothetical protein